MILALVTLIPKWQPSMRNTMLVPHLSSKIISPLDPLSSDARALFNWTIHTVIEVHGLVVPVEGLLRLESSSPGAIRGFAGKSARGASMRTTTGVMGTC